MHFKRISCFHPVLHMSAMDDPEHARSSNMPIIEMNEIYIEFSEIKNDFDNIVKAMFCKQKRQ